MEILLLEKKGHKLLFYINFLQFNVKNDAEVSTYFLAPLLLGFTVVSDHLKAGEHSKYCGLLSGAVPVSIPINFWSQAKQSAGDDRSSDGSALLLFLSDR